MWRRSQCPVYDLLQSQWYRTVEKEMTNNSDPLKVKKLVFTCCDIEPAILGTDALRND